MGSPAAAAAAEASAGFGQVVEDTGRGGLSPSPFFPDDPHAATSRTGTTRIAASARLVITFIARLAYPPCPPTPHGPRRVVGGRGEGGAVRSGTWGAPAVKRVRSEPVRRRAGKGSPARRRVSAAGGRGPSLASRRTLPYRRPRSVDGSATRQTSANAARTLATCERAKASGGPSTTLAAY